MKIEQVSQIESLLKDALSTEVKEPLLVKHLGSVDLDFDLKATIAIDSINIGISINVESKSNHRDKPLSITSEFHFNGVLYDAPNKGKHVLLVKNSSPDLSSLGSNLSGQVVLAKKHLERQNYVNSLTIQLLDILEDLTPALSSAYETAYEVVQKDFADKSVLFEKLNNF
ncbi:hypothetical protein QTV49_004551 [Vibrio vulnificus]|nr:hypothetical protein [Vibrio vulnificus]